MHFTMGMSHFLSGVRIAAAESLPFLLECAQIRGAEYLTTMWNFICPELLKAVDTEPEIDIKSEHMHALAQVGLVHIRIIKIFFFFFFFKFDLETAAVGLKIVGKWMGHNHFTSRPICSLDWYMNTWFLYIWIKMSIFFKYHLSLKVIINDSLCIWRVNPLWPVTDFIWHHRTCSTLVQVMT